MGHDIQPDDMMAVQGEKPWHGQGEVVGMSHVEATKKMWEACKGGSPGVSTVREVCQNTFGDIHPDIAMCGDMELQQKLGKLLQTSLQEFIVELLASRLLHAARAKNEPDGEYVDTWQTAYDLGLIEAIATDANLSATAMKAAGIISEHELDRVLDVMQQRLLDIQFEAEMEE